MSTLDLRTDGLGGPLYILGEQLVIDVRWRDKLGQPVAIEETNQYAATIFRWSGETVASIAGAIVGGVLDPRVRFAFPLSIAAQLADAQGISYSLSRLLPGSSSTFFVGSLPVRALASTIIPANGLVPDVDPGAIEITLDPQDVYISHRGPAGSSCSQQMAATLDPNTGHYYLPSPDIGSLVSWLKGLVVASTTVGVAAFPQTDREIVGNALALAEADVGVCLRRSTGTPLAVTVPLGLGITGWTLIGVGENDIITVTGAQGVTVNPGFGCASPPRTSGARAIVNIIRTGPEEYQVEGAIEAI